MPTVATTLILGSEQPDSGSGVVSCASSGCTMKRKISDKHSVQGLKLI
jgi:hypothetical protein